MDWSSCLKLWTSQHWGAGKTFKVVAIQDTGAKICWTFDCFERDRNILLRKVGDGYSYLCFQLWYIIRILYCIILYYVLHYIISCILYYIILYYIISYHIILYYIIMLYYIILYYIILYYIILYYIILYYIILYYSIRSYYLCYNVRLCQIVSSSRNNIICVVLFLMLMFSDSCRNLGVMLDSTMTMSSQISSICKSVWYQLRNLGFIRKYLTRSAAEKIVHALISSRLDFGNALLYNLPQTKL